MADSIYSSHRQQREKALPEAGRAAALEAAFVSAFESHIVQKSFPVVLFDEVSVQDLARAFYEHPILIKSILATVNVAQRAVKRDLGLNLDTYSTSIPKETAFILAGYIKPLLPKEMPVPGAIMLDHFFWVDKEMRRSKGRWEKKVVKSLNEKGRVGFSKRRFSHQGCRFELDAAYPGTSGLVRIGVDVKRFESPRDFHKRGDEVIQKAAHLKSVNPEAVFFAVIYYPFPSKHDEVRQRYANQGIDGIFFAADDDETVERAAIEILTRCSLLLS